MFHLSEPLIWICCHNRQCQSLNSQNSRNALSCTYALVYKKCWVIRYGFHLIWRESNCVCFKCNTLETRVHVVLTMCLVDNRNKIHNRVVKCGSVICVSFTKDRDFVYLQKKKNLTISGKKWNIPLPPPAFIIRKFHGWITRKSSWFNILHFWYKVYSNEPRINSCLTFKCEINAKQTKEEFRGFITNVTIYRREHLLQNVDNMI